MENYKEQQNEFLGVKRFFSPEEQSEIISDAIDAGVGYVIPEQYLQRYISSGGFCKSVSNLEGIQGKVMASFMRPVGISERLPEEKIQITRRNLEAYYKKISVYYKYFSEWLRQNESLVTRKTLVNLELDHVDQEKFFYPGSLFRADVLLAADRSLLVCDPNVTPLGGGAINFLRERLDLQNDFSFYEESLATSLMNGNTGGVVTTKTYPNWMQHEYTAQKVRARGVNFTLIDPDDINSYGKVGGLKPDLLVRHVREPFAVDSETIVINPKGVWFYESPLWTALLPLLEENNEIMKSIVPGLLVRKNGDEFECAVEAQIINGKVEFQWVSLVVSDGKEKTCLPKIRWIEEMEDYYANAGITFETAKKQDWYIKGLHTSGSKAVGVLDQNQALPGKLKKFLKGREHVFGDLFVLQPSTKSTYNIDGNQMRSKADMFFSGDPVNGSLKHLSTSIIVAPMNAKKVHGGSDSGLIICE
jgi:hypothetical protein